MTQSTFEFDHVYVQPSYGSKPSIQERFEIFNAANPWVIDALLDLALKELEGGFKTSVDYLCHALRWHYRWSNKAPKDGQPQFKLSNNFTSRYARLLLEREPALAGVLTLKKIKTP